jgi:CRP/FNR family transcriptional regulator, cyclic AMP receptor protein
MDTSSYFIYPGEPAAPAAGILPEASQDDWDTLLAHTETRRFRPGEWLVREGERDRALYLLSDGRLETHEAPAVVGELAFLDGLPQPHGLRAVTHGEAERLSYEAFETLSARAPRLARDLLLDVARLVAAQVRA